MADMHPEKAARRARMNSGPPISRQDLECLIQDAEGAMKLLSFMFCETTWNNAHTDDSRPDDDLIVVIDADAYSALRMAEITASDRMKALVDAFDYSRGLA